MSMTEDERYDMSLLEERIVKLEEAEEAREHGHIFARLTDIEDLLYKDLVYRRLFGVYRHHIDCHGIRLVYGYDQTLDSYYLDHVIIKPNGEAMYVPIVGFQGEYPGTKSNMLHALNKTLNETLEKHNENICKYVSRTHYDILLAPDTAVTTHHERILP